MTEYREGDSEMDENENPEIQETVASPEEEVQDNVTPLHSAPPQDDTAKTQERKAVTAVLLVQFEDGRIDAVTTLPSVDKHHEASVREVRNMCMSMVADTNTMLNAKMVMQEFQMQAAKAQLQQQLSKVQQGLNLTPQQMASMQAAMKGQTPGKPR